MLGVFKLLSWGQADTTESMPMREMGQRECNATLERGNDSYWQDIFDKYDLNKDGRISLAELQYLVQSSEAKDLPQNVVEKIMALSDKDNSRDLDYEEFKSMIHNPVFKPVFGHIMYRYIHDFIPKRSPVSTVGAMQMQGFLPVATNERVKPPSSYESTYTCWPPTFFMVMVSLLEVALFTADAVLGNTQGNGTVGSLFHYHPDKREQAWRALTYMLVHASYDHIIVNVLIQLILGVPLEMVHRWWRVALVYIAGVVAGSLAFSISDPQQPLVGASAGVAALLTAHIATIIMNWSEMKYAVYQMIGFVLLAGWATGRAIYDISWGLNETVGHVAHLAGALAGLLVGIGVLRNLRGRKWERRVWWAAMVLYFSLMAAGILANIFWKSRFDPTYRKFVIVAGKVPMSTSFRNTTSTRTDTI